MSISFGIAAGVTRIISGILWFTAAGVVPSPAQAAFLDAPTGPDTPYAKAWHKAGRLNQAAAAMTGLAALFGAVGQFVDP